MHFIYIKKPQNTCKCQQRKCFNFFSFQFFFGGEGVLLPLNNGGEIWYTIKIYFHSHFCCAVSLMLKHKTFTGYSKPVRIQWTTRNLIDKYMYRLNWTFFLSQQVQHYLCERKKTGYKNDNLLTFKFARHTFYNW